MSPSPRAPRPLTVVLHAVAPAAAQGRIAGRAEVVDTGEHVAIRRVEDLVELLTRLAREALDEITIEP